MQISTVPPCCSLLWSTLPLELPQAPPWRGLPHFVLQAGALPSVLPSLPSPALTCSVFLLRACPPRAAPRRPGICGVWISMSLSSSELEYKLPEGRRSVWLDSEPSLAHSRCFGAFPVEGTGPSRGIGAVTTAHSWGRP